MLAAVLELSDELPDEPEESDEPDEPDELPDEPDELPDEPDELPDEPDELPDEPELSDEPEELPEEPEEPDESAVEVATGGLAGGVKAAEGVWWRWWWCLALVEAVPDVPDVVVVPATFVIVRPGKALATTSVTSAPPSTASAIRLRLTVRRRRTAASRRAGVCRWRWSGITGG